MDLSQQSPLAPQTETAATPKKEGDEAYFESKDQAKNGVPKVEKPIKIIVSLPTHSYFTSGLRELSRTLAVHMSGFSQKWAYRFQSVVDELINNAIEFGSDSDQIIEITFMSMMNQYIEVFVEDSGTGKEGKSAKEIEQFVEARKAMDPRAIQGIRGRGLAQIVSNWADVMEFKDNSKGGITAHVIKHFQKDESLIIPI